MKQRRYRIGLVGLCVLAVSGGVTGLGATEVDDWMQRFEAGVKAREAAHYTEAEPLLAQVMREAEQAGDEGGRVALAANSLGLLYHDQGRLAEAESLYTRALGIWEAQLGPEHEDVAAALNNLAEIAHARGEWAAAEPLYERVLAIERKTLGAAHPDVAISLNNLAELYRKQGRETAAESSYHLALTLMEQAHGPDHAELGPVLNNLAAL
ncbi:MAG: tetratricopeptide repeat protein, partial [Nitrospira sp.]|nr:tetratricopeptide repeat protein [Nitrospira sp.]